MDAYPKTSNNGYSPAISAELSIHGQQFHVASLGPGRITLRTADPLPPGRGTIRMSIDGRITIYHIELSDGINPQREDQPFSLIRQDEEQAA